MGSKEFKKTLDTALGNQGKTILEAMDFRFGKVDKRFDKLESRMNKMQRENLEQHEGICKQIADLQQESKMSLEIYKEHDKRIGICEQKLGLAGN